MKILNRLINLGSYLLGEYIILKPTESTIEVDEGIYNIAQSKEAAIEFFHKTYTNKP